MVPDHDARGVGRISTGRVRVAPGSTADPPCRLSRRRDRPSGAPPGRRWPRVERSRRRRPVVLFPLRPWSLYRRDGVADFTELALRAFRAAGLARWNDRAPLAAAQPLEPSRQNVV